MRTRGRKAFVYRLYSESQELLYVGMTFKAIQRIESHSKKPWFKDVSTYTLERFKNRHQAWIAEMWAIFEEQPLHNSQYKAPANIEWMEMMRRGK